MLFAIQSSLIAPPALKLQVDLHVQLQLTRLKSDEPD